MEDEVAQQGVDGASNTAAVRPQTMLKVIRRSDGGGFMQGGMLLFFGGLGAVVLAAMFPDTYREYSFSDPTPNLWKWPVIWAGAGAANLGFLLWLAGEIIRAIYFLPGQEEREIVG